MDRSEVGDGVSVVVLAFVLEGREVAEAAGEAGEQRVGGSVSTTPKARIVTSAILQRRRPAVESFGSIGAAPWVVGDHWVTAAPSTTENGDELISPELALVDPVLAARLRGALPELVEQATSQRQRASESAVHVLRRTPPASMSSIAVGASRAPISSEPPRDLRLRGTLISFAAGALVAAIVTVGVVAEMGPDGVPTDLQRPTSQPATPVPPAFSSLPPPSSRVEGGSENPSANQPPKKPESLTRQPPGSDLPTAAKTSRPRPATSATARRFAWAPVHGAVGYRVELFRGGRQVLQVTTNEPVFELARRWRHRGRAESLVSGPYRWLVWPILKKGVRPRAVVQARVTVP